jgi:hypothetical protein
LAIWNNCPKGGAMRSRKIFVFGASVLVGMSGLSGVASAVEQKCDANSQYPDNCVHVATDDTVEEVDVAVKGEVVTQTQTSTPAAVVKGVTATQQDGLGGAQGALALTGGDAIGLGVIGAGLLGAGALVVLGSRRKGEADS